MASAGSIFVDLLLKDSQYVAGLNKARANTKSFSSGVNKDLDSTKKAFQDVLNPVTNLSTALGRLSGAVAAAFSVQRLAQYTDTWRQLTGRLSLVDDSFNGIIKTQENLLEIAQRTRQPLEGVANFYSRLAQFIPEAERAQYDLLGVTESVSSALAITGETGASASAAMIQFTQAIGTNFEAAGQELRSLQEQAPRLTQALQKALGDGTKSLQQLKDEGKLTRESVLNALSGTGEQGRKLAEELAKVPVTISQAFTQLDSAFLSFIGNSDAANAGASALAETIKLLADNLDAVATALGLIATVFAARVIPKLGEQLALWVSTRGAVNAYAASITQTSAALGANTLASIRWAEAVTKQQVAAAGAVASGTILVNRAGQAAVATTTAMGLLTTSLRALGAAFLGLFGGPVGLAIFATLAVGAYLYKSNVDKAKEAQEAHNKTLERLRELQEDINFGSREAAALALEEREAIIERSKARLAELGIMIQELKTLNEKNALTVARTGMTPEDINSGKIKALDDERLKVAKELNEQLDAIYKKDTKKTTDDLKGLAGSLEQYITGITPKVAEFNKKSEGLKTLLDAGRISIEQYNAAYARLQKDFKAESGFTDITRYQKLTLEAGKFLAKKQEELRTLQMERDWIGLTTVEMEKLRAVRELEVQAAQEASVLRGKDKEDFLSYVEEIKQGTQEAIQANYEASRTASAGIKEFFTNYIDEATNSAKNIQQVLTTAFKGAEDAFVEFVKTGKLNFKDLANSIIEDLIRIQFKSAVAGIFGAVGGGGGLFSGLFGGGGGTVSTPGASFGMPVGIGFESFGGLFADGGYLQPGQWGIAGEEGAEIIMGGRSGATIVPQNGTGGNTYNIDARGADQGAVTRLEKALLTLAGPGVIERRVSTAQTRGQL